MALLQDEYQKQEKMNGVIYDMSPSAGYKHGIINNNINTIIKAGLKGIRLAAYVLYLWKIWISNIIRRKMMTM